MILESLLKKSRVWILSHENRTVTSRTLENYEELVTRRMRGEPMAYILGRREFMGHYFKINPNVLIPRPETELLVETALDFLHKKQHPHILDLGTGSGIVAISLALARPDSTILASDISADALELAMQNAYELGATLTFLEGAWYKALQTKEDFDIILSNPPYIAADDLHLEQGDLRFEPRIALTDYDDGFRHIKEIVKGAGAFLKPRGWLWIEHGWEQGNAVRHLLQEAGFKQVVSRLDLAGIERISGGHL